MTVTQAAAGRSTLVALVIAVACGSVVLVPALALLFSLFLRGRLDMPESHAPDETAPWLPWAPAARRGPGPGPGRERGGKLARHRNRVARRGPALGRGRPLGAGGGRCAAGVPDASWTRLGVAGLLLCAVAVFALTATPLD